MPPSPTPNSTPRFSRRNLLVAGLAVATSVSACSSTTPNPPATVSTLLADNPFYIAHRGGGRNWPEMTAYAYDQAAKLPYVKAIEISVCVTADGVLACSHDPNTERMTGTSLEIAATDWATLARLQVTSAETDDPAQPSRPFTRFDDVIDAHLQRLVCFVEPKTHPTNGPLMERMIATAQPERVVWKQPINSVLFTEAKAAGFATWGYVLDEPAHLNRLDEFAADSAIDLIGVSVNQTPEITERVVRAAEAHGKPIIMWPVSTVADRTHALSHGARGLMTSDIVHVPVS